MCECIVQSYSSRFYPAHLGRRPESPSAFEKNAWEIARETSISANPAPPDPDRIIRPNHPLTAVMSKDGDLECLRVRWGWSPVWSMGTRPPLTHLPLEIVMRSKVFERMRSGGRALVAVDGWFDLARDDSSRDRPVYMRPRFGGPVFLGALVQLSESPSGCNGLVLVTTGGGGATGPLQLLAFSGESAGQWLDPTLGWEQAQELASQSAVQEPEFEHVAVSDHFLNRSR
ncbi:MAG: hypothetical protein JWR17_4779 [Pseudomonas sp.]|uniref:SOS response-associated peptidase family protein n=1 Tax=Pseudomonas sp. TaxID=306 RepID=UPI0034576869|nr:hypothetical protein [Pseudomonas sp.]